MKASSMLDRLILFLFVSLVSAVPLAYSSRVTEVALYPKFLVLSVIVFMLSVLWLAKVFKTRENLSLSTPLTLPILFFLIVNIVSLNRAINVYASLFPLALLATSCILFFTTYHNLSQKDLHVVQKAWVLAGAVAAVIGIGQYLGLGFYWIPSAGNPSSTFAYRNMAAMFMILTIPTSVFLFLTSQKRLPIILWGLATTLLVIYLIYTRTRGAWVGITGALIVSITAVWLLKRKRRNLFQGTAVHSLRNIKRITGLTFLIVIVIMATLKPNIKEVPTLGGHKSGVLITATSIIKEGRDSGRWGIWRSSLDMFKDGFNWLSGVGLNNWQFNYPNYARGHMVTVDTVPHRPHNDFLWILTETGIVGLGVYVWLLATAAYMVFRIVRNCPDGKTVFLTISMGTSLLAILGHSLFSFPKERITPTMLFWFLLAIITHIHENLATVRKNSLSRRTGLAVITVFILVSAVSVEVGRRHHLSDTHYRRALLFPEGSGEAGRLPELRQADHYFPHNWRTAFYFGLDYLRLEDFTKAVSHFKRCLSYSPYFLNAQYNLGLTYYRSGDYPNAIRHFLESKRITPTYTSGIYNLALSWHKVGYLEEAENNYRVALALDPNHERAHNNLGVILKGREEYEEAAAHFKKALEIDPDYPQARANLDSMLARLTVER